MINNITATRLKALKGLGRPKSSKPSVRSFIRKSEKEVADNMALLHVCHHDWNQLAPIRREHERFVRYMNGDQWSDYVDDPDNPGKKIQEKALISRTGVTPMTNNIIQQYMRNVLGQVLSNKYQSIVNARRDEDSEVAEMLTNTIQACLDKNENSTIDINHIILLHSMGIGWSKITYSAWDEQNTTDGRVSFVNQNRIAWNQDCEDPRLFDLRRITELHSYTINELIANFAHTPSDERELKEIYKSIALANKEAETISQTANQTLHTLDFWGSVAEPGKCRVIEVWQKLGRWVMWVHDRANTDNPKEYLTNFAALESQIKAENERRVQQGAEVGMTYEDVEDALIEYEKRYEEYWYVKFLTPTGVSIFEMESPYEHQSHPYVYAAMPIIDGVAKPLFSDLVEMQRNINRQRTLLDTLIAGSAKNTLFIPEEALEGRSIEEYAEAITKVNGVISYRAKAGVPQPEFLSRNSTNIGIWDVLNFDMQQAQAVSGLSGAIQGQVARSGTPSSLYAQQAQNTMLNFVLLFDRFNSYCTRRDDKLLRVLIQYYNAPRHIAVSGKAYSKVAMEYIPEKAKAILHSYSLVPSQSMDTPVFRQRIDDYLMELVKGGMLPMDMFLQHTTLPFGKKLLADMKSLQQQQAEGGQIDMATVNNIQQAAEQNSNPQAVEMIKRMAEPKELFAA